MILEGTTRRLPVYLVLDCSGDMSGARFEAMNNGLKDFEAALKTDPHALESVFVSIITFESEAQQLMPLTEAGQFKAPVLEAQGGTSLGKALDLLGQCIERDVKPKSPDHPGDWRPLIFLMTDGEPTDSWEGPAEKFKRRAAELSANVIAIGCGPNVSTSVLKKITKTVLMMPDWSPEGIKAVFEWISDSVKVANKAAIHLTATGGQYGRTELPPLSIPVRKPGQKMKLEATSRRILIYLVLDIGSYMSGDSIEAVNNGLKLFEDALKTDPHALESAFVSIIVFESEAQQLMPLTEAGQFKAPVLEAQGNSSLGKALNLLGQCLDRDVKPKTVDHPGDWKPVIIFLMTIGEPTDEWQEPAREFQQRFLAPNQTTSQPQWGLRPRKETPSASAVLFAIGCGQNVNRKTLDQLGGTVLDLHDLTVEKVRSLFEWTS